LTNSTIKYLIGAICSTPLLPIMYLDAKRLRKNIPDLPEATGFEGIAKYGVDNQFKLIVIGESTMAGVGVNTNEEGFAGNLAKELAQQLKQTIHWNVYAKSGYNARKVATEIFPTIKENKADIVVIGIGANDAFELHSPNRWRKDVLALIDKVQSKFPNTPIYFTNMPPVKSFPVLSTVLQSTVGTLAELLETELIDIVNNKKAIYYDTQKFTAEKWQERHQVTIPSEDFFSDGVHPSKLAYQLWAKDFADFIMEKGEKK